MCAEKMFSFFRRGKTSDSDKNKSDKKEAKIKEKYTPGLGSPSTSKRDNGKDKSKPVPGALMSEVVARNGDNATVIAPLEESVATSTSWTFAAPKSWASASASAGSETKDATCPIVVKTDLQASPVISKSWSPAPRSDILITIPTHPPNQTSTLTYINKPPEMSSTQREVKTIPWSSSTARSWAATPKPVVITKSLPEVVIEPPTPTDVPFMEDDDDDEGLTVFEARGQISREAAKPPALMNPLSVEVNVRDKKSEKINDAFAEVSAVTTAVKTDDADKGWDTAETRNLVNQETKYQEQLAELRAQLAAKDVESNNLLYRIEELQRDVTTKSSGMDRLQAELTAAHLESQCVRQKLRLLESDVADYRQKNVDLSDELLSKSAEVATAEGASSERLTELEESLRSMEEKMKLMQTELDEIRAERDQLEAEREEMEAEREEEMKIVQDALEEVSEEKTSMQLQFEKLRTVHTDQEQKLLGDFEWKLREVEQACKRRLEDKDRKLADRINQLEAKAADADKHKAEVEQLKGLETEVTQLRGMTLEQQRSLRTATRRTEELQVSELVLKEQVSRLEALVDKEKKAAAAVTASSEKSMSDLENKLRLSFDLGRRELSYEWEVKMQRLRIELDHRHESEKQAAVHAAREQAGRDAAAAKIAMEKTLANSTKEIATLKERLAEKETFFQREIENAQTNADRDILELRRKLDKLDMSYQGQIEKLKENHEKEMEQLSWESGRKMQQMEQNWQLQNSSTRTTLELVKEQMERDSQTRLESAEANHRRQLEEQWERLIQEKEEEMQQLEENHLKQLQKVKEEFETTFKDYNANQNNLVEKNQCLEKQLLSNGAAMGELQTSAVKLQGSVQELSEHLANKSKEMLLAEQQASQKLRERETQMETEHLRQLADLADQRLAEATQWQARFAALQDQLGEKISGLAKRLEESESQLANQPSREEDLNLIAELRRTLTERDRELANVSEEKRFYEAELAAQEQLSRQVQADTLQLAHGPRKKGGGRRNAHNHNPGGAQNPSLLTMALPFSPALQNNASASPTHILRSRSVDFPTIKVPSKSPIRKPKRSATNSNIVSTL